MDLIVKRLADIGVSDSCCVVADCVDSGRIAWLRDYIKIRESLRNMEVDIYVW